MTQEGRDLGLVEVSELVTGELVETPDAHVALLPLDRCPPVKDWLGIYRLTPTKKDKPRTYFMLTPDPRLRAVLEGLVNMSSGKVLLHRMVLALRVGGLIGDGFHVHHRDNNHLDNRADNLEEMPEPEHRRFHDRHPRLNDPPGFRRHRDDLRAVVVFKSSTPANWLSGYVSGIPTPRPAPPESLRTTLCPELAPDRPNAVSVNLRGINHAGDVVLEQMLQGEGLSDEPGHRLRLLYSEELRALGLKHKAALRARKVLAELRRRGGRAAAGVLVGAVTAKSWSPRTAYNTLGDLVRLGLVVKEKAGMYFLKREAFKVEPVKK